mgnify:CR=1 FL=1
MKKIFYYLIAIVALLNLNACVGYKPIFESSTLNFKIVDYSIAGDKKLGNKIYKKLYNVSKRGDNPEVKNLYMYININKNKEATTKDSAGKILAYKISVSANISLKDIMKGNQILNESFSYSSSYKAQDLYSETIQLENRYTEDLINKIYQNLLIKISEATLDK